MGTTATLSLRLIDVRGNEVRDPRTLNLDTGIDENGRLLQHLIDVFFVHPFRGETRPLDIHEHLALAYPLRELGYQPVVRYLQFTMNSEIPEVGQ